jgi:hydroxymethylbilane synthase
MTLRLGTRGSQLALFQANAVAALLKARAQVDTEVVVIKTTGDHLAEATLSQIGGKRLFVKEIEDALLEGEVDLAVHSSKDMPAVLPEGLDIGAVLPREDARDAVILPGREAGTLPPSGAAVEDVVRALGRSPRIGTSSVRRSAQLTRLFPGARFAPIRGNLDTRLRKLDAGEFDAIVLAAAGLKRLEHASRISATLPVDACVPAPGQGIIAVEIRRGDHGVQELVAQIDDSTSAAALVTERAVVRRLGGGCQMPIGAFAEIHDRSIRVRAIVIALDGSDCAHAEAEGSVDSPDDVGVRVAEALLEQGAQDIIDAVQRAQAMVEGLQP